LTKLRFENMKTHSSQERRTRRSNDIMTALHYQLAFARHQGGFDALVLADSAGCVVAGAGAWATCELLAAYAPLLAHDASGAPMTDDAAKSPAGDVEIQKFTVDGGEVLLCSRGGGNARAPSLRHAASGCQRILSA
jgi:hypothetical protein